MAKKSKKKVSETQALCDALFEIYALDQYVETCLDPETYHSPDCEILLLLIRIVKEKLQYFQDKYNFQVAGEDQILIQDFPLFMKNRIPEQPQAGAKA